MTLPINTFTIHNLVGFMVTGSLAVTFYLVYLGMGRRTLDLLAANFIACAAFVCLSSFLTDNMVPAGASSRGWPGGPTGAQLSETTLLFHRIGWAFSLIWMPVQLHFVLVYCGSKGFLRRHIRWVYAVAAFLLPLIWTPTWFSARAEPLAGTSSWKVAIPWIPDIGWPLIPFLLTWLAQEGYVLVILWRTRHHEGAYFDGASKQWSLVFLAFLLQILIGLMDPISLLFDYSGISFIPIGSTVMGVLLAVALIRSRISSHRARERLEREKAALLESVQQPLVCFDTEHQVHWANDAAARSAHTTVEALIGSRAEDIWAQLGSEEMLPVELAIRTGRPHRREVPRPDGSTWILHASPILGTAGESLGAILLAMDITRLRQVEEDLRKANVGILSAREEERCRVAKDLHDSVAQSLAALEMVLRAGAMKKANQAADGQLLDKGADRCGELVREVRHICHELYPPTLGLLGLAKTLEELADPYRAAGKECRVLCSQPLRRARFSPDLEIALFRLAQEALNNATRHGKARRIEIQLDQVDSQLCLSVTDDGVGFDPENIEKHGMGMSSMRGRLEGIGGSLEISSQPGRTCLRARVPCESDETPGRSRGAG